MAQHLPEPVDPAAFANLEPDFILPEQFFPEQQPNWSGELSLLWTVFSDGIETFRKEILLGREHGEVYLETLEWIQATGLEAIFSFDRLCSSRAKASRRTSTSGPLPERNTACSSSWA